MEPFAANVQYVKFFDLLRKQTIDSHISADYRKIVLLGQLRRHVIPFYELDRRWNLIRKPSQLGVPGHTVVFCVNGNCGNSKVDSTDCTPKVSISRGPADLMSQAEIDEMRKFNGSKPANYNASLLSMMELHWPT